MKEVCELASLVWRAQGPGVGSTGHRCGEHRCGEHRAQVYRALQKETKNLPWRTCEQGSSEQPGLRVTQRPQWGSRVLPAAGGPGGG